MKEIKEGFFTGERALYGARDLRVVDSVFHDGESPLKEAENITLEGDLFRWKYPLWYCKNVHLRDCTLFEMARAGIWYTQDLTMEHSVVQAPKNFRRCDGVTLVDVAFPDAGETLWHCKNVTMKNVTAKGDYFAMDSENMTIDGLVLDGKYSFDGVKNVTVRNSRLVTKDAFWNSENVTVYDSFVSSEYLGWNSKNMTFVNCTIESLQGLCYIENLTLKNCKLLNTDLAFEYSSVDAQISTGVVSVFNPISGRISAPCIGELILEEDKVDPEKTEVLCDQVEKRSQRPEWLREGL